MGAAMAPLVLLVAHVASVMITGAAVTAHIQRRVPAYYGDHVRVLSPREALWRSCEHDAMRRYVAGTLAEGEGWLARGAAECVAARGYPEEARRGPPVDE